MAINLNEFSDPGHPNAEGRKMLLDGMREVLVRKGYRGKALESRIKELLNAPLSDSFKNSFRSMFAYSNNVLEYHEILKQEGFQGEKLENKINEIWSMTPTELQNTVEKYKK